MSASLAACGSTGSSNGGTPTAAASQTAQAGQICGQAAAAPNFSNGISTIAGGGKSLSGAGSTFVAPMLSVWTKAYSEETGTQVAYQSIGSGGGVQQIIAKTVDFGDSDVPMTDAELSQAGKPILHVPVVLGAVVPTYNLPGVPDGLKFTGDVLGKIFDGDITTWNDPAITALNPGVTLPSKPIAVVHRSDGSGTTGVWTNYLTKASPDWVTKLGGADKSKGKTVAWPVGIGGKGNEGVSGAVHQTDGAIGYVELQYALAQKLPVGQVKNKAGNFIQPCVATVTAAASAATFPADLRGDLTNEPGANAYPITGTTFTLIYQDQTDPAKAAAMVNFLSWVLTKGQNSASSINYAPLGTALQQQAIGQLHKVTLNGSTLAP
ncbi:MULTISPECIES: phosphate ABC transporter substrate-binding protein PstS [unclassified Frankia]|uniref:phosphate ABC transporter substrate-binding protein PstS n=1 Tax=unclassified Frankia TaxID=2632575 RepID=UPI00193167A0|nr:MULTISPECIES: phosphate ABC transporter substrate-binding protein PstS [unclassified Frankia]MBL7618228.1 phosphate ABC transporter substrate-binding protein PstS [Frankia sp. AgB1.8]